MTLPELVDDLPGMVLRRLVLRDGTAAAGRTLAELDLRRRHDVTLLAIRRGESMLANPGGDEALRPHDELLLFGRADSLDEVARALGCESGMAFWTDG